MPAITPDILRLPDIRDRTARWIGTAIVACFVSQLLTAIVIIPPWQNPDEPQHLMTVRQVLRYGADYDITRLDPSSERAIVASMAKYGWWRHYRTRTPDPVPSTFVEGPGQVVKAYFGPPDGGSRLYYRLMAGVFRALDIDELLPQLYAMRVVSLLAGVLTILCIWAGSHAALGSHAAVAPVTLAALHPQFVLVSAAASPDAIVNLAGGLIWWQSSVLLVSDGRMRRLTIIWAAALGAFLLRRVGAPLLLVALIASALVIWRGGLLQRRPARATGVTACLILLALAGAGLLFTEELTRSAQWIQYDPVAAFLSGAADASRFPSFVDKLFRTFWLSAGWLRYPGPGWWHVLTLGFVGVAAVGLVKAAWRNRPAVWLALAMVVIQVAAVVALYFGILRVGPQGRYLFPVLPAIAYLLWVGWEAAIGSGRRPLAAVSFICVAALLNASAWMGVVFPAFL